MDDSTDPPMMKLTVTYLQESEPAHDVLRVGDRWQKASTGQAWRWTGTRWEPVRPTRRSRE